jgi:hypothetical protein
MIGTTTLTGQRGAFRQPSRWGRNESGNFDTWTFEATTRQEIESLAANIAQTIGLSYDVTESFGKYKLDIYFPWNMRGIDPRTDLVIKWEMFTQKVEKDLLSARVENPNTVALLSTYQVQQLRQFMLQPPDGDTIEFPTAATFQKKGESNGAIALAIYNLMQQGVTSFPVEQPKLRRTFVTSNQYAIQYALTNVRRIISTVSLVTTENIPNSLLFSLPNESWIDPNPDAPSLAFGWLKSFPTVQQVALLKWSIVQEWEYGLWATLLYGNPL